MDACPERTQTDSWWRAFFVSEPSVNWWEPYWHSTRKAWRGSRGMFSVKSWVEITFVSLLLMAVVIVPVKLQLPQLQLGFLWRAVLAIPMIGGLLGAQLVIMILWPNRIIVQKKRLQKIGSTQGVWRYQRLLRIQLIVLEDRRLVLRFRLDKKPPNKLPVGGLTLIYPSSSMIGVSPEVDLEQLLEILPMPANVIDARKRFVRLRLKRQAV